MQFWPLPDPAVLRDATAAQLERAVASNHRELFCQNALASGGEVRMADELTWTYGGPGKEAMVAFPSLEEGHAGMQLDLMMDYYRQHHPKGIGCWSLDPASPVDLGARLLARGFQPGWKPRWMALDLNNIKTDHPTPAGLVVVADRITVLDAVKNLPYAGDDGALSPALLEKDAQRTERFIALLDGKIVGQSALFFTTGEDGVAGLYNVGVVPRARQRGIGKALVLAACLCAKAKGYQYAVLNGTGPRMYEQVGFQWISYGLTWWLMNPGILSDPPAERQVALAEAVGKGDMTALNHFGKQFPIAELNAPIANGMTLMQLATHCRQPAAVEWLLEHGVVCSVLDAWDLGWKERASEMLAMRPESVNDRYGDLQITLLHIAAERNDIGLAQLALAAKPDLTIKDTMYNSTALGWAEHFRSEGVARLLIFDIG